MKILLIDTFNGSQVNLSNLIRDDGEFRNAILKLVEEKGSGYCEGYDTAFTVAEIPDNATDYWIMKITDDGDCTERIIYVTEGKMHYGCSERIVKNYVEDFEDDEDFETEEDS